VPKHLLYGRLAKSRAMVFWICRLGYAVANWQASFRRSLFSSMHSQAFAHASGSSETFRTISPQGSDILIPLTSCCRQLVSDAL
jgi:hypothetical protein